MVPLSPKLCNLLLLCITPTLISIRFESAYSLCHVNTIDAHSIWFASDAHRKRITTSFMWKRLNPQYARTFNTYIISTCTMYSVLLRLNFLQLWLLTWYARSSVVAIIMCKILTKNIDCIVDLDHTRLLSSKDAVLKYLASSPGSTLSGVF